ncbi:MAG: hypothetical protein ACKKL5_00370 [Candidatus Komeilibacteria bacterium]
MNNLHNIVNLYTKRQKQKQDFGYFGWQNYHREYLLGFWKAQKQQILRVGWLSLAAIVIEVTIFFLARVVIRNLSLQLSIISLWYVAAFLVVAVIIYLLLSYFSIFYQKRLLVDLLNDLRKLWFKIVLRRPILASDREEKDNAIAKVSYHFSLLSMGFNSALVGTWQAILIVMVLLLLSAFVSWTMFIWSIIIIIFAVIFAIVAYKIAFIYVSREQTFYTQIIKHMLKVFYDLENHQLHNREAMALQRLNKLVELDSWFRVRRDIWMKFGADILFVLILLGGAILYIVQLYWPHIFRQEAASLFLYGVIATYSVRLFYLSLRAGLFYVPLRLGLWLSIPEKKPAKIRIVEEIKKICFRSDKFRLFDEDKYFCNQFCFQQGQSYLIVDKNRDRLDALARIFAGMALSRAKPWILSVNGQRYLYKDYFKYHTPNYLISANWRFQGTVGDFLLPQAEDSISPSAVTKIYEQLAPYNAWHFLFKKNKVLAQKIDFVASSIEQRALLQIAYAIIHQVNFVIIDSSLVDLQGKQFVAAIRLLRQKVAKCIIIILSTADNAILDYEEKFSLKEK